MVHPFNWCGSGVGCSCPAGLSISMDIIIEFDFDFQTIFSLSFPKFPARRLRLVRGFPLFGRKTHTTHSRSVSCCRRLLRRFAASFAPPPTHPPTHPMHASSMIIPRKPNIKTGSRRFLRFSDICHRHQASHQSNWIQPNSCRRSHQAVQSAHLHVTTPL
jgi:hypothetical protein